VQQLTSFLPQLKSTDANIVFYYVLHLPLLKCIVVFHVNTLNVGMFMVFENEAVSCNRPCWHV